MPPLYKRNNIWTITVEDSTIILEHGQIGGQKQKEAIKLSSPYAAQAEALSRWNHKKDRESYSEEPYNWPKTPMLALEYEEHGHKLPQLVMIQPKLDGIRCIANNCELRSRQNTIINSVPHIKQALSALADGVILDGELYCHGMSFQDHLTAIKRDEPIDSSLDIRYCVYDAQIEGMPFKQRNIEVYRATVPLQSPLVQFVSTTDCVPKKYTERYRDEFINQGYEGVIIRDPQGVYEYGVRSASLQKYKREDTTDYKIVGWTAAKTGREKGCAIAVCSLPVSSPNFTPLTFTARLLGSLDYRRQVFLHQPTVTPSLHARILHYGVHKSGLPKQPRCDSFFYGKSSS